MTIVQNLLTVHFIICSSNLLTVHFIICSSKFIDSTFYNLFFKIYWLYMQYILYFVLQNSIYCTVHMDIQIYARKISQLNTYMDHIQIYARKISQLNIWIYKYMLGKYPSRICISISSWIFAIVFRYAAVV